MAIRCGRPNSEADQSRSTVVSAIDRLPTGSPENQAPWMIWPMKRPMNESTTDQPIQ